jgi:thiamine biosynthesis lipoprotein
VTVAGTDTRRTLHVEHCMGTVFTIDIRDVGVWDDAIGEIVAWLHHVDAVFSTYKPDSDISRIRRQELEIDDADPDVAAVLDLCGVVEEETAGYFTAFGGAGLDPSGLDPTGMVKGWAIERASQLLRARGSHNHAVNGGGDIQLAGEAAPGRLWAVGISDPFDGTRLLTTVTGRDFAIATSGVAERGAHIVNPHTCGPADQLASVTVIGASLTRVDAYATAAFAMGPDAYHWIEALPGHNALLVFPDRTAAPTTGFHHPAGR